MSRWSLGGERGIGKLLRLQGVEVAGEKRHERLVRFIGGGELEQDDGRRTLLFAGHVGGNDVVVADIDGQLRVIDDVVRERGRCDGIGGTIELESLAGDLGESIRGILVRVFVREVEALAVDEEFHDVTIQAGLGCRHDVLVRAGRCYTTLTDAAGLGLTEGQICWSEVPIYLFSYLFWGGWLFTGGL